MAKLSYDFESYLNQHMPHVPVKQLVHVAGTQILFLLIFLLDCKVIADELANLAQIGSLARV
jgi:hypothetical protein